MTVVSLRLFAISFSPGRQAHLTPLNRIGLRQAVRVPRKANVAEHEQAAPAAVLGWLRPNVGCRAASGIRRIPFANDGDPRGASLGGAHLARDRRPRRGQDRRGGSSANTAWALPESAGRRLHAAWRYARRPMRFVLIGGTGPVGTSAPRPTPTTVLDRLAPGGQGRHKVE